MLYVLVRVILEGSLLSIIASYLLFLLTLAVTIERRIQAERDHVFTRAARLRGVESGPR